MDKSPESLIETCIRGRYKVSPWGLVALPCRLSRMPPGIDPEREQSVDYENLVRHKKRRQPIGRPVYKHSLAEVESHLREAFGDLNNIDLVIRDADIFIFAFSRCNPANYTQSKKDGLFAFRELWRMAVVRLASKCKECAHIKKRLALSDAVS